MVTYIFSIIAIAAFMAHFWCQSKVWFGILWGISAFFAIWCVYAGIFGRILAEAPKAKAYATCGLVWGIMIFSALVATGLTRIGWFLK